VEIEEIKKQVGNEHSISLVIFNVDKSAHVELSYERINKEGIRIALHMLKSKTEWDKHQ